MLSAIFVLCIAIFCNQLCVIQASQSDFHQQQFNKPQFGTVGPWKNQNQKFQPQNQQFSQQQNRNFIPITSYTNEMHGSNYNYMYTTGNGIQHQERGYTQIKAGSPNPVQVAQGSYSYTAPNGELVEVRYIADELGYRAEGTHIPKAPPIPEAIQKSLQLIARSQQPSSFNRHQQQPPAPFISQQQQYQSQWNPQKWK